MSEFLFSTDVDSSADSSSSSESEGDDTKSVDSLEMGFMYLDENKCPTGCNRKLYELAFSLREKRYKCESETRDAQSFIENSQIEMEQMTKKFSKTQAELDESNSVLNAFRVKSCNSHF
jgi:cilia- and flagella-associated protein 44